MNGCRGGVIGAVDVVDKLPWRKRPRVAARLDWLPSRNHVATKLDPRMRSSTFGPADPKAAGLYCEQATAERPYGR